MMRRAGWKFGIILGLVVGLAVGGTVAWAAIPNNATGVLTACYPTAGASKGVLHLIEAQAGAHCAAGQASVSWQRGGVRWLGPWSSTRTYYVNDVVSFGGSSYVARTTSRNIVATDANAWTVLAAQGVKGDPGTPGTIAVAWVKISVLGVDNREVDIVSGAGHNCTTTYAVAPGECSDVLPIGAAITLQASQNGQPPTWGGDCTGQTGYTCALTLDGNRTVTATFP